MVTCLTLFESNRSLFLNDKFKETTRYYDVDDSDCNKYFGPDQFNIYIELPYTRIFVTSEIVFGTLVLV